VGLDEGRSLQKKVGYARLARILDASARKKEREDQLRRITRDFRTRVAKWIECNSGVFKHSL